jgi:ribosomal protein S21
LSIGIKVRDNSVEALDAALRKLKARVKKSGLMEKLKEKECFRKPSDIRRHKRKLSLNKLEKLKLEVKHNGINVW